MRPTGDRGPTPRECHDLDELEQLEAEQDLAEELWEMLRREYE